MSNTNSIGSFLAALRKAHGLTQKQLAEKLNVSDKAISRWERDECSPDLSLIPVLAELYGVTSDEILRGRRADPAVEATPQAETQTKKRLQHVLNQTISNYRIKSMISCLLAALGLVGAMICNLGFLRAYLGFFCGAVFFIAAVVCQTIFSIQANSSISEEEFDAETVTECRRALLTLSERSYILIALLTAFTLPLLAVEDTYWGLDFTPWLTNGLICCAIIAVPCLLIRHVNRVRKGLIDDAQRQTPLYRLRVRTVRTLLIVFAVTSLLLWGVAFYLSEHPHRFADSATNEACMFEDFDSFKAYMEQPKSSDGTPLEYHKTIYDEEGREIEIFLDEQENEYWYYTDHILEIITDNNGDPLCTYKRYNDEICYIEYTYDDDMLPIYAFTFDQYESTGNGLGFSVSTLILMYLAEAVTIYLIYRKKKDTMGNLASKRMLDAAGVKYTKLKPEHSAITLDFVAEEDK
jgi:transcriptional regulator with XRE-family HTH domain